MTRELPTGTVTFLFTDIEGSTKLLHDLGAERFSDALAEHRRILRHAFGRRGGVEVDTPGDAFFYAFPDATGALEAARVGQEALAMGPIRVRIGIHAGTPHVTAEGYIGADVHKGARIAAVGHGGQVLVSKETCEDLEVDVTDLGEHRLKDFDEPVWIYQLGSERFPPLKTISNTNLPRPASSFVGREQELKELIALLQDGSRIVTMTGPGGTGKTRLSIEAAAELVPDFKNGVFWIGLAALRDPALVALTIAQTLGAKDGLAEHVGDKEMLLVLDNFEQVIDAAAELTPVVESCSNLRLLVTSRELLRISGEVEFTVPPLERNEAVELFCRRSGLLPNATISELCDRLDNLPLAVELAAARVKVLSPEQILDRLGQRLDLLKGGRDVDPRQVTLRATIEWSYDLLSEEEKTLFARLAVFRGGWTLEAAEEVVDADLDTLHSLVEKSLVRRRDDRFVMLATIREFAAERFDAAGKFEIVRSRHSRFFLAIGERAEVEVRGNVKRQLDQLEADLDNFRFALDHLQDTGQTQEALSLAAGLWRLWYQRGPLLEGRDRIESALRKDDRPTAVRVRALVGAAALALNNGDADTGVRYSEESVEIARTLGDPASLAHALFILGGALTDQDDFAAAKPLFEETRQMFAEIGDDHYAGVATMNLAYCLRELGDVGSARRVALEGLESARHTGNRRNEAGFTSELAMEALDHLGKPGEAVAGLKQSLTIWWEDGDSFSIGRDLYRLGRANTAAGNLELGARLLAAAVRMYEDMNTGEEWFWDYVEKTRVKLREQLDEESFQSLWTEGRKMTVDEAVALALDSL